MCTVQCVHVNLSIMVYQELSFLTIICGRIIDNLQIDNRQIAKQNPQIDNLKFFL